MRVFNRYFSQRGLTVFAFELVLIAGSGLYAMHLHGGVDTPGAIGKVLFITALCQLSFYYHDLYDLTAVNSRRELLVRLLQASGVASLLLAALYVMFPRLIIGHGVLASSVLFFVVAIVVWRLLFLQVGRARGLQEHVLIVGTSPGVRIEEPETTYERLTGKIMLGELKPSWLIFSDGFRARKLTRGAKRVVDVV